jgi:hypothetical protein
MFLLCIGTFAASAQTISLSGTWRFALDRADAGLSEQWFNRALPDKIKLPGALQSQGDGDEISVNTPWVLTLYDRNWFLRADYQAYTNAGSVKVPFVCQPPRHYLGAAWYQRDLEIPKDWQDRRVILFLERPRWESRVWLDDQFIGTNISLCAPHEYELGVALKPGKHHLTVRVDNRLIMAYRPDAHSVSDSLDSTWNGIVGKMELRSTPRIWVDTVRVFPDVANKSIRVQRSLHNLLRRIRARHAAVETSARRTDLQHLRRTRRCRAGAESRCCGPNVGRIHTGALPLANHHSGAGRRPPAGRRN